MPGPVRPGSGLNGATTCYPTNATPTFSFCSRRDRTRRGDGETRPSLYLPGGVLGDACPGKTVADGFKYVGNRFSDQNNVLRLGSYALVDASASWSMEPVRFTVSAHNLLNKTYFTSGGSNADSVNPAAPRQLVFIASYVYQ